MKNIKTISFSIFINSDREKIWSVLWDAATYEKWTSVFMQGSHYKGELKQGKTIQFLGKDGGGISSLIEKLIENEQMVFAHQKELKNGIETGTEWQGSREIYYLKNETANATELQVIVDITDDIEDYFNDTFPKALTIVKQLSEQ